MIELFMSAVRVLSRSQNRIYIYTPITAYYIYFLPIKNSKTHFFSQSIRFMLLKNEMTVGQFCLGVWMTSTVMSL